MSKTAKLIKSGRSSVGADQRLYKMDPPHEGYEYVVVSGVNAFGMGEETLIFGADAEGRIDTYADLTGSFRGSIDHEVALAIAGYKVES